MHALRFKWSESEVERERNIKGEFLRELLNKTTEYYVYFFEKANKKKKESQ